MFISGSCVCARLQIELPKGTVHLQSLPKTHLSKENLLLKESPNHLAATESKKLGDGESEELPARQLGHRVARSCKVVSTRTSRNMGTLRRVKIVVLQLQMCSIRTIIQLARCVFSNYRAEANEAEARSRVPLFPS